jgi:hypothetical protein
MNKYLRSRDRDESHAQGSSQPDSVVQGLVIEVVITPSTWEVILD